MITNSNDLVVAFCEHIFSMKVLSLNLSAETKQLISNEIEDYKLFKNANDNCDFNSIIQEHTSLFISKNSIDVSADGFKDTNLDTDWNKIFFDNLVTEIQKYDSDIKKKELYWIKEIIDSRFWTSKNVAYITNYAAILANSMLDAELAITKRRYNDLDKKVHNSEKSIDTISKDLENAKIQVQSTISSTNNLIPNMLTSLGIFVTIIVTIVALYISNVLGPSKLEFAIPQMRYARYVLSGQITFNCVFFLLYFIAKITGKTIHLSTLSDEKLEAIKKLNAIRASLFYNPLIWITNLILVLLYFVLYDWWMVETYIWSQIEILIKYAEGTVSWSVFWFAIADVTIVTAIPIISFLFFYNKSIKLLNKNINKNENQN